MLLVPNVVLNYHAIKLSFVDEHIPFKEKYRRKMIYKFNFLLSKLFLPITTQPCNYFLYVPEFLIPKYYGILRKTNSAQNGILCDVKV